MNERKKKREECPNFLKAAKEIVWRVIQVSCLRFSWILTCLHKNHQPLCVLALFCYRFLGTVFTESLRVVAKLINLEISALTVLFYFAGVSLGCFSIFLCNLLSCFLRTLHFEFLTAWTRLLCIVLRKRIEHGRTWTEIPIVHVVGEE